MRPETWRRLFSGRIHVDLVRRALVDHESAGPLERRDEAVLLERFGGEFAGRMLFIYGAADPEAGPAADGYARTCESTGIRADFHRIEGANHNFYALHWESEVLELTGAWLRRFSNGTGTSDAGR
jgi:hypothetical protein